MVIRQILEFIYEELELEINRDEVREIKKSLNSDNDFCADIDGQEYRFIHSEVIWDLYVEGIREVTEDCYDLKAPDWLVIDWEETAQNTFADGYGHHFNHYDGNELECTFDEVDYYIFRTN